LEKYREEGRHQAEKEMLDLLKDVKIEDEQL
jgi:hypothetical protein